MRPMISTFRKGSWSSAGDARQAADHFERARQGTNDPEAIEYLGQTLLRVKKYQEAEHLFHDLTTKQPARPQAWLGLAISQSRLGKYREALDALDQAQTLIQRIRSSISIGSRLHELKSFNQSSALFSRAMALSPDLTPTARYYTGMSYYERGMIDRVKKEIEAAIASRRTGV